MSRPKRNRIVVNPPLMEGFRPFGISLMDLEPVILFYEEYESLRLSDYEGLTQEQSAERMEVSRPTFTRIYEKARQSIAQAFVEGKAIFIEGGNYHTEDYWYKCEDCLKLNIAKEEIDCCNYCRSKAIRRLNKKIDKTEATDVDGYCICVDCNTRMPHIKEKPCKENECPKCGKKMMREGSYHHQLYLLKKCEINIENNTNKP
jgi:uncharacterized protein